MDLKEIEAAYRGVYKHWQQIDDELDRLGIGRKDTPFTTDIMDHMLLAWEYLDHFMKKKPHSLFSNKGGPDLLEINHLVHYGLDWELRHEYRKALEATTEKFSTQIVPIRKYYKKHRETGTSPSKIAAEIYISILGMPQLFVEGNHRSGSVIASWINLVHGLPPFVLDVDNAIAYFSPAQEIKKFNKRSVWRSMTKLPKYKKSFRQFWEKYCDMKYVRK